MGLLVVSRAAIIYDVERTGVNVCQRAEDLIYLIYLIQHIPCVKICHDLALADHIYPKYVDHGLVAMKW